MLLHRRAHYVSVVSIAAVLALLWQVIAETENGG